MHRGPFPECCQKWLRRQERWGRPWGCHGQDPAPGAAARRAAAAREGSGVCPRGRCPVISSWSICRLLQHCRERVRLKPFPLAAAKRHVSNYGHLPGQTDPHGHAVITALLLLYRYGSFSSMLGSQAFPPSLLLPETQAALGFGLSVLLERFTSCSLDAGRMIAPCPLPSLPTLPQGARAREEMGKSLARISAHAVGLLPNRWTMRTPAANPHPPDALRFSRAFFSGHFPTDEGKQQIMTVKLW